MKTTISDTDLQLFMPTEDSVAISEINQKQHHIYEANHYEEKREDKR